MTHVSDTGWHCLSSAEAVARLESDAERGLSAAQVSERQMQFGPNELIDTGTRSPLLILWE